MKTFLFSMMLFCIFSPILTRNSKSTCFEPSSNLRVLPIGFFIPATLLIAIGILIWYLCFRQKYNKYMLKFLDHLQYLNPIPQGEHSYNWYYFYNGAEGWISNKKSTFSLTFNGNLITGKGYDEKHQSFSLDGKIEENKKVCLRKIFCLKDEEMTLYLTEVPNCEKPGFVGFSKLKYVEGYWAMFPKELNLKTQKIFPFMNSKILRIYFALILFFSLLSFITYELALNGFYSYYYPDHVVGCPWGAFMSLIGLFLMLIFANPFNYQWNKRENLFISLVLIIILILISIVCLVFSVLDMTAADFVMTETLFNAKNSYQLENSIADTCRFQEYGCSIVWYGNYTVQTSSCLNYYINCVSFEPKQGSCSDGLQNVYDILLVEALFQFVLWALWVITVFLICELLNDRWPGIAMRLMEWNQKKLNKAIEMNSQEQFLS